MTRRGFTLIEVMIALVVSGMVASELTVTVVAANETVTRNDVDLPAIEAVMPAAPTTYRSDQAGRAHGRY